LRGRAAPLALFGEASRVLVREPNRLQADAREHAQKLANAGKAS